MTTFVLLSALLAIAALGFVLRPLWRRKALPVAAAVAALALATGLLYRLVGTPAALDPTQRTAPRTMAEAVARLEAELRRDPNQVEGLRLLGRAYLQQAQPAKARDAFARAARLVPDDADIAVEAAETRALADPGRRFDAGATALLEGALRVQPMHQRGRWFLGIAQRQAGRDADAAKTWEPLLAAVDAKAAAALRPQIEAARKEAGLPPLPAAEPAATAAPARNALTVNLAIDPALAARMPEASVFVIARVPGGPPMPVAVEKHPLRALPDAIVLDDADGPMPTQKLSALREVEVLARVSASGNAMRQPGDVESTPVRIALPASGPLSIAIPGE